MLNKLFQGLIIPVRNSPRGRSADVLADTELLLVHPALVQADNRSTYFVYGVNPERRVSKRYKLIFW